MQELFEALGRRGMMLATAESCTGGLIAKTVTDAPGSSAVFDCGFITYSNESKIGILGVPAQTLDKFGAVSAETAEAMASGALSRSGAQIAVSCTGIAGPGGALPDKPVGLVYIGIACKDVPAKSFAHRFDGDRGNVRRQTADAALRHVLDELGRLP